jgi:protein MpaA
MDQMKLRFLLPLLGASLLIACSDEQNSKTSVSTSLVGVEALIVPEISTTTTTTTTSTTTSVAPITTQPGPREITIGMSHLGRPILAVQIQDSPHRPVIAIGSIHGDESMGLEVVERLRNSPDIPEGLNLWIIPTVNPDGLAASVRGNARGVDLNRNFATDDWQFVGQGSEKYSGEAAASEVETKAVQQFVLEQQPLLVVWWHQFGYYVDEQRTVANFDLIRRFSELTGLPITDVGCGSTPCVGNATVFINSNIEGASSFVVELPRDVSSRALDEQAQAFLAVAEMATQNIFAQ